MKMRLSKAAREFNVGTSTIIEFLQKKGHKDDFNPNSKLDAEMVAQLVGEYQSEKDVKKKAGEKIMSTDRTIVSIDQETETTEEQVDAEDDLMIHDTAISTPVVEQEKPQEKEEEEIIPEPQKVEEKTEAVEEKTPVVPQEEEKAIVIPEETPPAKVEEKTEENIPLPPKEEVVKEEKEVVAEVAPKSKEAIPTPEKEEVKEHPKEEAVQKPQKTPEKEIPTAEKDKSTKIVGHIDLESTNWSTRPKPKTKEERKQERLRKKDDEKQKRAKANKIAQKKAPAVEQKKTEKPVEEPKKEVEAKPVIETIRAKAKILTGPKVIGTIKLEEPKKKTKRKPEASSSDNNNKKRKNKRQRIRKPVDPNAPQNKTGQQKGPGTGGNAQGKNQQSGKPANNRRKGKKPQAKVVKKHEPTEEEIQKQIKETLARLTPTGKSKASKHRRKKRDAVSKQAEAEMQQQMDEQKVIQVAEYVTANDLATMVDIPVTQIIATCMGIGLFVSINQRLDAETIVLVAEEFGFKVEFVGVEATESIPTDEKDFKEEDLIPRAPVVTVMGHVDHGKTKLLDYVRKANVVAGEAGGITQHIGAYEVVREDGKKLTFLDTPGHEAFTAMRARGAQVTDIAIIVIATDDNVMPQTKEAINHAQAAGIPIVFALNKIDRPAANPDNIRNELSQMNILVEEWGGKYQSQEISALKGDGIDDLLEKVLLEAEMLDLKATPKRRAIGSVIESSLDKGRGYVTKMLVQNGTIRIGDMVLAGSAYGKVKAMFNERNQSIKEAGPATPVLMLGLNSAPQAGDNFNVLTDEREVKAIATKREQLQREQSIRTQKHITLDEIGRRLAIGDFKELNVIVKADVDGSVEALSDSLIKLSTSEIQLNVIHKSVGQITESDVLLASASDAIIVGFQVRPNMQARRLADTEGIEIKHYSIIYQAIDELKLALEGMLAPTEEEKIICNIEVREVFKISKVGTIAGCMVLDGKIHRSTPIRIIRDGVVTYTGKLGSLKRFKDDVREVSSGYECGLNIENFNDIKIGDIVEGYEMVEIKRKL
ncbi:MAG: translation initiation factor IF-2 [Bacteroidetes bacterium 4572_77]|nr:MAG: translation initiation factor IF-2 [Bacteroidetes bacterium 4572_77]